MIVTFILKETSHHSSFPLACICDELYFIYIFSSAVSRNVSRPDAA